MYHVNGCSAYRTGTAPIERRGHPSPTDSPHYYATCGLRLASQLEFPELRPLLAGMPADVEIVAEDLPDWLEDPDGSEHGLQYSGDRCQFNFEGIARYRVEQGHRIRVDRRVRPKPGASTPDGDPRLYPLGTALGALLHQKHWFPLNLSALETPSGIWGFTGASGAGKSTLVAWLHYCQGWPLVCDDVGVIRPGEVPPYLYPGPPRLKLCEDALATLGVETRGLVRKPARAGKYHLIQHQGFRSYAQPLRALVTLEPAEEGESATLEPLNGREAFKVVTASLYHPEWAKILNGSARLMTHAADLARRIRVYRYRRHWSLDDMEQSLAPLVAHIHEAARHEA
ncbi:hypothetical protein [Halomonas ramblicola]|uniref:hypothetical protein n=1 Tax=Halomonas ramblicola TaxID=747349 RepID=UPI0025B3AF06|nr:hypothetical protein [Halomonas ramblicola]MDN3520613.1 hypothetical protein [Halomonas ramblicola]